jgi:hypothetical protein
MDSDHFGPATVIRKDRLSRAMESKVCPRLRNIFYFRPRRNARPQVIVHCKVKGWIKRPDLLPQIRSEKHRLLWDMGIPLAQ